MDKIESYQWQSFPATDRSKNNIGVPNKTTDIYLNVGDGWMHSERAELYINYKIIHKNGSDYSAYGGKSNVKLIDNFVPYLFSSINVTKRGQNIFRLDYPGITSTVLQKSTFSTNELIPLDNAGISSNPKLQQKEDEVLYPLRLLGGFFKDFKEITWEGDFTISFTWSSSMNDVLYRWAVKKSDGSLDVTTLPGEGKIVIENFEINVPIVYYEPSYAIEFKSNLIKNPISTISFYDLQTFELTGIIGKKNFEIDITNYYHSLQYDMPYFVFVVFQTNRIDNQEKDSSEFDHCSLQNISLKNGRNEQFPSELWNINPPSTYKKAYRSFTEFKRITNNNNKNVEIAISPFVYITRYPIYLINTYIRKNVDAAQKTSMKICATFHNAIPNNTIGYVIMYGKKSLTYDFQHSLIQENF